jgi:hypothetical protein
MRCEWASYSDRSLRPTCTRIKKQLAFAVAHTCPAWASTVVRASCQGHGLGAKTLSCRIS